MISVEIPRGGAEAVKEETGKEACHEDPKTMETIGASHEDPYAGADDQCGRSHESDRVGGPNFIV